MYALIDSNNFFVSCERLFRPDLENTPVIVLSSNDGCAISRSAEAKALGVKMGEPIFKLRQRFRVIDGNLKRESRDKKYEIRREIMPRSGSQKVASGDIFSTLNSYPLHHNSTEGDFVAFSANFELYGDISERIATIVTSITPHIELYSIDEAFLDLTQLDIPDYTAWGAKLRALILQNIGIPVSVGIAPTKTLCKLANHHAKTHPEMQGVLAMETEPHEARAQRGRERVASGRVRADAERSDGGTRREASLSFKNNETWHRTLEEASVSSVWGVGWRLAPKLRAEGVFTALDLARLRPQRAGQLMGVHGKHMVYELNGTSCLPLQARTKPQQMISRGRQFGKDTSDLGVITAAVAALANRAARELRREGQLATHAVVTLRTNRLKPGYTCVDSSARFYTPTADTGEICSQLIRTLRHSLQPKLSYHKAEVTLYGLVSSSVIQTDVFGTVDLSKLGRSQRRMAAVDAANAKYGPHAIRPAAELLSDAWRPKSAMLSPRYTSSWNELPEVKAS
jgi:DNA polymerase V